VTQNEKNHGYGADSYNPFLGKKVRAATDWQVLAAAAAFFSHTVGCCANSICRQKKAALPRKSRRVKS
jgi:hypothetical protein